MTVFLLYNTTHHYQALYRILSQVVAEKSLTEKSGKFSFERKKNEQIKGLMSNIWLFFVTQYNSSLSSFVPNFRILSQEVAEKSLTEKKVYKQTNKQTDRQTDKHSYRKGKNYIPPIYFVLRV